MKKLKKYFCFLFIYDFLFPIVYSYFLIIIPKNKKIKVKLTNIKNFKILKNIAK
jgi:hypothetical protein